MARTRNNVIANYAGTAFSAIAVYVFVPFYLQFLGVEAYGLVGFYATLQGVLLFAERGLSATLTREIARLSGLDEGPREMLGLLRLVEAVFVGLGVMIATVVFLLAPWIAEHWLNTSGMPTSVVSAAVRWMGLAVAIQLPISIYRSVLIGLQQQVLSNAAQTAYVLFRQGGAVVALWAVAPTIEVFFVWQVAANLVFVVVERLLATCRIPRSGRTSIPLSRARTIEVLRFSAGMALISLNSVILMQADKLIISKFLELETLGYYTLAATVAQAVLLLGAPVATAEYPRLTQLMAAGRSDDLARVYHRANRLVASIVCASAFTLALFSSEVVRIWTGSSEIAERVHPIASLLVLGSIGLALQAIPYRLALAAGWLRLTVYLGLGGGVLGIPLLAILVSEHGAIGAGISWIVLNWLTAGVFFVALHRRLLRGHLGRLVGRDILPRILSSAVIVGSARWIVEPAAPDHVVLPVVATAALLSTGVGLVLGGRRFFKEVT